MPSRLKLSLSFFWRWAILNMSSPPVAGCFFSRRLMPPWSTPTIYDTHGLRQCATAFFLPFDDTVLTNGFTKKASLDTSQAFCVLPDCAFFFSWRESSIHMAAVQTWRFMCKKSMVDMRWLWVKCVQEMFTQRGFAQSNRNSFAKEHGPITASRL